MRRTERNSRFRSLAWLTLAGNVLVVLWGAYVRATGSGAGCGGHWPLCNGVVLPRQPEIATIIEFTHRFSSGLALILVVLLYLSARRTFPAGDRIRGATTAALVFMVVEALLGAGLVLFELVADNTSVARAAAGALHLMNTFLLLAALSLASSWSTWPYGNVRGKPARTTIVLFGIGLLGVLMIGMTGAIAALGDTLFPARSLVEGFQQDLEPGSHFLLRLRAFHPLIAIGVGFYLMVILRWSAAKEDFSDTLSRVLAVVVGIQLIAGALNVVLLAPVWLQLVHLFLADGLWIGLIIASDRKLFGSGADAQ